MVLIVCSLTNRQICILLNSQCPYFYCRCFPSLVFPAQRSSFSFCCRAGLVVLNSLSFCLSVKVLISPSNLNEILAGQSNLGYRCFPFITLNMSCHSLLACRVSAERSALNFMGIPLYVICCFQYFLLYLIFDSLINMCLSMFLFGFILYGTLCASWT